MIELVDYESDMTNNLRWADFEFRSGDVVIAAPGKSGTTWTQNLVGSLLYWGKEMPGTIAELSPWLDMKIRSTQNVFGLLAAQDHRRFIKTHTPLDGVQWADDVSYVCVGRDPRGAAISMTHHINNLDGQALIDATAQLGGNYEQDEPIPDDMPADFYIRPWVTPGAEHLWPFEKLANIYTTYWERRDRPNVSLFHFADYLRDLPAEVRRLADLLAIEIDDAGVAEVAERGRLDSMRTHADTLAPDAQFGTWKNAAGFFRSGSAGEWRQYLSEDEICRYDDMVAEYVDRDLATWISGGWGSLATDSRDGA